MLVVTSASLAAGAAVLSGAGSTIETTPKLCPYCCPPEICGQNGPSLEGSTAPDDAETCER